jgi:hypothetical protein
VPLQTPFDTRIESKSLRRRAVVTAVRLIDTAIFKVVLRVGARMAPILAPNESFFASGWIPALLALSLSLVERGGVSPTASGITAWLTLSVVLRRAKRRG